MKAQLQRQIDERNFAMGIFAVSDLIGIDVWPHMFEQDETGDKHGQRVPGLLEKL